MQSPTTTSTVLYSKKKFDVGLDKIVFWLGNVVSVMCVKVLVVDNIVVGFVVDGDINDERSVDVLSLAVAL